MPAFKTSRWIRMQIVLTTSLSTLRLGSNYKGKAIIKYESPMFIIAKFNWFGQNSGLKGSISSFLAIKRIIYLSLIFVKHNQKLWFHSFTHAKMESSLMSIVRAHEKTMENVAKSHDKMIDQWVPDLRWLCGPSPEARILGWRCRPHDTWLSAGRWWCWRGCLSV